MAIFNHQMPQTQTRQGLKWLYLARALSDRRDELVRPSAQEARLRRVLKGRQEQFYSIKQKRNQLDKSSQDMTRRYGLVLADDRKTLQQKHLQLSLEQDALCAQLRFIQRNLAAAVKERTQLQQTAQAKEIGKILSKRVAIGVHISVKADPALINVWQQVTSTIPSHWQGLLEKYQVELECKPRACLKVEHEKVIVCFDGSKEQLSHLVGYLVERSSPTLSAHLRYFLYLRTLHLGPSAGLPLPQGPALPVEAQLYYWHLAGTGQLASYMVGMLTGTNEVVLDDEVQAFLIEMCAGLYLEG